MNPVLLLMCCFFGIPVRYWAFFGRRWTSIFALWIAGDPTMPPTAIDGLWSVFNPIRNLYLARCKWSQMTLIDVGDTCGAPVYFMFNNKVVPRHIKTRRFALKLGAEDVLVAVLDTNGDSVPFTVAARGPRSKIMQVVRDDVAARACGPVPLGGVSDKDLLRYHVTFV